MQPVHFYGLALLVVLGLALLSGDRIAQRVSWVVLLGWTFSRLAEGGMGYAYAPYIVPSFDAALAVLIGVLGYRSKSALCFVVVLLYLAQETIAAVALPTQRQGEVWYYSLNSGIFLLKLLAIGGWSIGALLVDRGHSRGLGFVPGGPSGGAESKP